MTYLEFLHSKIVKAEQIGFDVSHKEVHCILLPHQRDIVVWALKGGCRAVFASFGLGKTLIQLEIPSELFVREFPL